MIARMPALSWLVNFRDNDQVWHDMTFALIQAGVDLAHVVLLGSFTEGQEIERFRIQIRISPQNMIISRTMRGVGPLDDRYRNQQLLHRKTRSNLRLSSYFI